MIKIQYEDFNIQEEIKRLSQEHTDIGAISSFIGLVRDTNHIDSQQEKIKALYLEHYPVMTEKSLERIVDEATIKWHLKACSVVHRIGKLKPTDNIVLVICCAKQRIASLQACEFIIHSLKVHAPFWKKEFYADGSEQWVAQKITDKQLAQSLTIES